LELQFSIPIAPTQMRQRISRKFESFFSESAGPLAQGTR